MNGSRAVGAWMAAVVTLLLVAGCAQVVVLPVPFLPASAQDAVAAPEDMETGDLLLDSPEAAIEAYLEGIAAGDLEQVLAATTIKQSARHINFVAYTQRLRALAPMHTMLPPENDFVVGLNEARATQQILGQTGMLIWGLLAGDEVDLEGSITSLAEPEDAERIAALLDTTRLHTIRLLAIEHPNEEIAQQDNYRNLAANQAAVYGADEFTERLAYLAFEEMEYAIAFSLLRYGEAWRIHTQTSGLSTLPMTGAPEPQ